MSNTSIKHSPDGGASRTGQIIQHIERHQHGALSDIILGGQDGLVNVLGVILGVAAATPDPRIVIAAGLAATFAESISMGAVAYTTTQTDRAHYLSELEREKIEIRELPDREKQEIREIYQKWGLTGDKLDQVVDIICSNEDTWLSVMMAEELHLAPVEESGALKSAAIVGFSAIVGSVIPLIPFLLVAPPLSLLTRPTAILVAIVVSALTLFAVGVYRAKTTIGKPVRSGLQMAIIGTISALAGFLIGSLFGTPNV
ncbi:MAG TPA: VIT1/CCC1 transporter family protein [Anaerolineae bacterium]|nr:VIT1/CCC1 transporter family protein [Anaerolineae bacterium]